jgi:hypothetical protein
MKSALLSPKFRLQTSFDIVESCMYPIKISWSSSGKGGSKEGNEEGPLLGGPPPLPNLPPVEGVIDQLNDLSCGK